MRISVGHILIFAGVGGYLALGPLRSVDSERVSKIYENVKNSITSLVGGKKTTLRTNATLPNLSDTITSTQTNDSHISDEPVEQQSRNTQNLPIASTDLTAAAIPSTPVSELKQAPENSIPKVRKRKRGRKTLTQAGNRRKSKINDWIGKNVSVQLNTGREVKGVLVEHTADGYRIELPGMGTFTYASKDVVSIKLAQ